MCELVTPSSPPLPLLLPSCYSPPRCLDLDCLLPLQRRSRGEAWHLWQLSSIIVCVISHLVMVTCAGSYWRKRESRSTPCSSHESTRWWREEGGSDILSGGFQPGNSETPTIHQLDSFILLCNDITWKRYLCWCSQFTIKIYYDIIDILMT